MQLQVCMNKDAIEDGQKRSLELKDEHELTEEMQQLGGT